MLIKREILGKENEKEEERIIINNEWRRKVRENEVKEKMVMKDVIGEIVMKKERKKLRIIRINEKREGNEEMDDDRKKVIEMEGKIFRKEEKRIDENEGKELGKILRKGKEKVGKIMIKKKKGWKLNEGLKKKEKSLEIWKLRNRVYLS